MLELPGSRGGAVWLSALLLVLGVLVHRIGFSKPAPIINPAYQSHVVNPAH